MFDYNKANKRATKIARQTGSHIGIKGLSKNSKTSMVLKAKLGSGQRNANVGIGGSKKAKIGKDNPIEIPVGPGLGGNGGVALIFWDTGVGSWHNANDTFYPAYDWKVNFIIYGWHNFSGVVKNLALDLQNTYGHRLENHGYTGHSYDFYGRDPDLFFNTEVEPARLVMEADGVDPIRVFAFSDGRRDIPVAKKIVDDSPHEMTVTTYFGELENINNSYCFDCNLWTVGETSEGISGKAYLAMDTQFENFNLDYILSLLEYCKNTNKVLIIGGHDINTNDSNPQVTHPDTIHAICQYVVDNNMTFYTLAELIDNFTSSNRPSKPYVRKIRYGASLGNAWEVGTKMQARIDYMDDQDRAETGTTFQWYRADDNNGTNEIAIPGGNIEYYDLVLADQGKYLRASVTPANAEDIGYEAFPATRHLVT